MALPPEKDRFHSNAVELANIGLDLAREMEGKGIRDLDPKLMAFVVQVIVHYDRVGLMTGFIERSYSHWPEILRGDRRYFVERASDIFGELPTENVNLFRKIFEMRDGNGKKVLSEEGERDIIELFQSQVRICIKYIHRESGPFSREGEVGYSRPYRINGSPVDLREEARKWGVRLDFPPL